MTGKGFGQNTYLHDITAGVSDGNKNKNIKVQSVKYLRLQKPVSKLPIGFVLHGSR